jgi:hypothetical protein
VNLPPAKKAKSAGSIVAQRDERVQDAVTGASAAAPEERAVPTRGGPIGLSVEWKALRRATEWKARWLHLRILCGSLAPAFRIDVR